MTGVIGAPTLSLNVVQGTVNTADPVDPESTIYPAPAGYYTDPNPATLADIPQIWGYRRDTWSKQTALWFGSVSSNGSWYVPVSQLHRSATAVSNVPCGMHFIHTGRAIEVLFAGTYPSITLIADGQYATSQYITTTLANGAPGTILSTYSTFTKFDFGSVATRRISVYGMSSDVGPCALAIGPQDTIVPWDRSNEPSYCAMTDSYGQGGGFHWAIGGAFWEAAALLGIPHIDLNAMGGTGYAEVESPFSFTTLQGNTFVARIPDSVTAAPDLFMTGGGINDQYGLAVPPLYPTAASSMSAFATAVNSYYQALRTALPNSVIAAMGPWAPKQSIPTDPNAQGKLDVIHQTLQSISGPWVLIDNLNGGWVNSSNASGPATGPWQTGTGNVADPKGDGNGDIYISADGTHPTPAGNAYLGRMLASNLAASILSL